ncbi:MAG: 5'-methylthioadenosine/adenosylhomocysteine nucleosidase [Oscillospiraceae bacterium]
MKFGIIGALSSEVALIAEKMGNKKEHTFKFLKVTEGTIGNNEVFLCCSSIGKVNAAIATQLLIDKFGIDAMINSGIAGAMGDNVGVLDVVISKNVCYHDADLDIFKKYPPYMDEYLADEDMINHAKLACEKNCNGSFKIHVGKIVTGDKFVTDSKIKGEIKNRCTPLCIEMEGAAIAHTAIINEIPFVIIRTMSDSADDSGEMDYDKFEVIAAKNSAKIVTDLIENY